MHALITATIGCICLAAGLHGFLLAPARMWERVVLVCAAFLLIKPGWITDTIGLVLLALVVALQLARRRAAAAPATR